MFDSLLMQNLLGKLQPHPAEMSVYRIDHANLDTLENTAREIAQRFAKLPSTTRNIRLSRLPSATQFMLPGGASLMLHHGSGTIMADRIVATPVHRFENIPPRADLIRQSDTMLRSLMPAGLEKEEDHMQFDDVVQIKAGCAVPNVQTAPPFVTHLISTFRRHLDGLPVLGRASAFLKFAPGFTVEKFVMRWRPVVRVPVDHPKILTGERAAERVLAELSALMPGRTLTLKDYTPSEFKVGYFSLPGKADQTIMAPVFYATFRPASQYEMARAIIVPATPVSYPGFTRVTGTPPRSAAKVVRPVPKPDSEIAHA